MQPAHVPRVERPDSRAAAGRRSGGAVDAAAPAEPDAATSACRSCHYAGTGAVGDASADATACQTRCTENPGSCIGCATGAGVWAAVRTSSRAGAACCARGILQLLARHQSSTQRECCGLEEWCSGSKQTGGQRSATSGRQGPWWGSRSGSKPREVASEAGRGMDITPRVDGGHPRTDTARAAPALTWPLLALGPRSSAQR